MSDNIRQPVERAASKAHLLEVGDQPLRARDAAALGQDAPLPVPVLQSFQRTRGVLRLMAAVIHSLWEKGDRNPLILPANVPLDDPGVQFELTRYLPDNWVPVIGRDIDGANSLPLSWTAKYPTLASTAPVAGWPALSTWAPLPSRQRLTRESKTGVSSLDALFQENQPLSSVTRCGVSEVPLPTCTRMVLAIGTRPSRPSPILPRAGQRSTGGIATR